MDSGNSINKTKLSQKLISITSQTNYNVSERIVIKINNNQYISESRIQSQIHSQYQNNKFSKQE